MKKILAIFVYEEGPQFSAANFSKFCGPVCQILRLTAANLPHIVINFLSPWTQPNMQYLSPETATDKNSLSTE